MRTNEKQVLVVSEWLKSNLDGFEIERSLLAKMVEEVEGINTQKGAYGYAKASIKTFPDSDKYVLPPVAGTPKKKIKEVAKKEDKTTEKSVDELLDELEINRLKEEVASLRAILNRYEQGDHYFNGDDGRSIEIKPNLNGKVVIWEEVA